MSFESARLMGRISTLLLLLLPIVSGVSSAALALFGFSLSTNPYIFVIKVS
jgi:hypothetical protein